MEQVDSSNHKFIKIEADVRTEIIISVAIRTDIGQIVVIGHNTDKIEVGLDMNKITGNFRGNMRSFYRQNSRGEYRNNYRNDSYDRSRNRSRERSFSAVTTIEIGVQAIVGPGQDHEQV